MIVAVDTGGTKTLVAVFDTDGHVVAKEKFPTPRDVPEYVNLTCITIDKLLDGADPTGLVIALPGTIVDGKLLAAGNLGWHDVDVQQLFQARYDCPVTIENDANLAGLAEARLLEPTPPVCVYLTVSTGIGTGIIVDGQIDAHFATSEGGRIALEHNGQFEQWEAFASGRAIHYKYDKLASEMEDDEIWKEVAFNIARGLLAFMALLRPDIIVVGGGVGAHFDKFSHHLLPILQANTLPKYIPTIVKAAHPEEAVIYGCYYHALDTAAA